MLNTLVQFANAIKGAFTAFDRTVFRRKIMPLNNDAGASAYACKDGVLFKGWKEYSASVAKEIIERAGKMCADQGKPFINMDAREEWDRLALLHEKKEVRSVLKERPGGIRWKAWMKSNNINVYGKHSVLRVETAINHAKVFKGKKAVFDYAGGFFK